MRWVSISVISLAMAACASVPPPLRGNYATPAPREAAAGAQVR